MPRLFSGMVRAAIPIFRFHASQTNAIKQKLERISTVAFCEKQAVCVADTSNDPPISKRQHHPEQRPQAVRRCLLAMSAYSPPNYAKPLTALATVNEIMGSGLIPVDALTLPGKPSRLKYRVKVQSSVNAFHERH